MNTTTTSSSSVGGYDFISSANLAVFYSYSVTMTFIVITSILNACILFGRSLRKSSCTYYFIASIPPVLLYVIVTPLNSVIIYRTGFRMHGFPITCQIVQYIVFGSPLLYSSMIICASIDRFCSSSSSARLRRFSHVRIAQKVIIIVWILILLYMIPFLFSYYYDYNSNLSNKCVAYTTPLAASYLMSRVIIYYFLIPIILAIFGILTIKNIQNQTRRIIQQQEQQQQIHLNRRTEGQLTRMLVIQVGVYFLFFTPSGITYIIVTFIPSMNTSYYNTIRTLTVVWQQGGFFIAFFLYILTGKIYREEFKKLFKWNQLRDSVVHPSIQRIRMTFQVTTAPVTQF